jgi:hypothetical protein
MTSAPILEDVDRVPGRPDITAWRRAARLHQHLWREQHGWPAGAQRRPARLGGGSRPVGSRVEDDVAIELGTNFLDASALDAAHHRLANPQPFQTLDESGLHADLLNSLALACNLFGPMWADESVAVSAAERWFRDVAGTSQTCSVEFDWSPGRRNRRWLDDTTSFDAAFLLGGRGGDRLIGIDVRYHESPEAQPLLTGIGERQLQRRPGDRLVQVTEQAELFRNPQWLDLVFGTDLEKIWRAHALVHAHLQADGAGSGLYVLIAPAGNRGWAEAAERYQRMLSARTRSTFAFRTLEEMLDQADGLIPYADELRERYLDVSVQHVAAAKPTVAKRNGAQLYVIGEIGGMPAVKIGVSDRPRSRLSDIAIGNPRELELIYAEPLANVRWVEHVLQHVLAPWRLPTNPEWFDVRHLVIDGDWRAFVERALHGSLAGAAPSPAPDGIAGHELLHVDGRTRAFRSVCTCGWRSPSSSIADALVEFSAHIEAEAKVILLAGVSGV